jgi:hypothetical protein
MVIDLHLVVPQDTDAAEMDSLLEACVENGLDGVCLLGEGAVPPIDLARASRYSARLSLFYGVEFSLERGRLWWIPADVEVLQGEGWRDDVPGSEEAMGAIADRHGGVMLIAHPYERSRGPSFGDGVFRFRGIHGVEIANAVLDQARNCMAVDAVIRMNVSAVGGTGGLAGPGAVGRAATVFMGEIGSQAALVEALLRGDCWAVEFLGMNEAFKRGNVGSVRGVGGSRNGGARDGRDRGPGRVESGNRSDGGPQAAPGGRRRRRGGRGRGPRPDGAPDPQGGNS